MKPMQFRYEFLTLECQGIKSQQKMQIGDSL
jgi:hypothetical protein